MAVTSHTKNLGLPVIFGRSKKEVFSFVQERIWKKLRLVREMLVAGKETLMKVVAQAIPNYTSSCYKILEGCCSNIESMLSKFWWGFSENQRNIYWMSWDRLGRGKKQRRLRI